MSTWPTESTEIVLSDGWKYRLEETFYYKLHHDFKPSGEFHHPDGYYSLVKAGTSWWIIAYKGCCWDGPSGPMPDHDFMFAPSLVHDILHWLIAKGIISVTMNDLIDFELERAINYFKVDPPKWQGGGLFGLKKWRAKWIRRATNTCDETLGGKTVNIIRIKLL